MVKFRFPKITHRSHKKDDHHDKSLKDTTNTGASDDVHSITTASVTETIADYADDDFVGKDIVYNNQCNGKRWDYLQNKQAMTTAERWSEKHLQKVTQMWDLSSEQQSKLLQLKESLADIDYWKNDPYEAVRFLREVRYNVKKADELFRIDHKWRIENDVDNILETYQISPIFNYFPIATLEGVDYEGDPIHLERPGAADCWSFYQRLGPDEIYKMSVYMRELDTRGAWHQKYEEQQGHPVKHFTIILDLEGLNSNHMRPGLLPLLGRILEMAQRQYPSFPKRVIILRAPRIFRLIWAIAQNFVQDNIKKLIVFTNPNNYLQVIDKYMDRSVLPSCICQEEGQGEGTIGFENVRFEGGKLPPAEMTDSEIEALLNQLKQEDQQRRKEERSTTPNNKKKLLRTSSSSLQVTLTPIVTTTTPVKNRKRLGEEDSPIRVRTTPIAAGYLSPKKKNKKMSPDAGGIVC